IRVQLSGGKEQKKTRDMISNSALITFRDVDDNVKLDGSYIKEGSAKQNYDPDPNTPMVTLQLKDASKFGEVTSEIAQKNAPDNLLAIWMDYEEGDSFEEESKKDDPKFISAP